MNRGDSQTFTLTPNTGYEVRYMVVDGASKGAVTSYTIANVTADHTIKAYFIAIMYPITASAGPNGSITASASVAYGGSKTFSITPVAGYHVADVLVDGVSQGAVTSYTFTNVTAVHTIDASFASNPPYQITATAGSNGSISPSGISTVFGGAGQSYTITPSDSSYRVRDVLIDGVSVGVRTTYTFTNVQANHTISATFTLNVYTITSTAGVNGSISPDGPTIVSPGFSQAYTILPDAGYQVLNVVVDGASKGAVTSFTFTNVAADHTIDATFTVFTYTIAASAGANGSIALSGNVSVPLGSDQIFTITPATGYHVADVLVDGVSVGAVTSYTFTNVTAAHTIAATFAQNPPSIITASAGPNGSISPSGSVSVPNGATQKFTMTPAAGYRVQSVLVDGTSVGAQGIYNFTNVTADHTISVTFELDNYTLSSIAYAGGSITPAGDVIVAKGGTQTYTIAPETGYMISRVVVDTTIDLGAVTSYTFTNITANHTIKAYFQVITNAITASAGSNGSISPSGSVSVSYGGSQTFTIAPAMAGYHVADVLVDGLSQGAITSYTFTNVTAAHTIAATFAENPTYTITAPDDMVSGQHGSISPAGISTVLGGTGKLFTITPDAGYHIVDVLVDGVSIGATTSYTFVNVQANHTISATFDLDIVP